MAFSSRDSSLDLEVVVIIESIGTTLATSYVAVQYNQKKADFSPKIKKSGDRYSFWCGMRVKRDDLGELHGHHWAHCTHFHHHPGATGGQLRDPPMVGQLWRRVGLFGLAG